MLLTHGEFGEFGSHSVRGGQDCDFLVGCACADLLLCVVVLCQCRLLQSGSCSGICSLCSESCSVVLGIVRIVLAVVRVGLALF